MGHMDSRSRFSLNGERSTANGVDVVNSGMQHTGLTVSGQGSSSATPLVQLGTDHHPSQVEATSYNYNLSMKESMSEDQKTLVPIFVRKEMNLSHGVKQYLYDNNNIEFLDCVNGSAHVGHCHPQVVNASHKQMLQLSTLKGVVTQVLRKYVEELVVSLPKPLSVCYLCNSGSEANDLALRLARQYTGRTDVMAFKDSCHGNIGALVYLGQKIYDNKSNYVRPDWVHHMDLPDTYRITTVEGWSNYIRSFEASVHDLEKRGRKIAALILEPMFVIPGVYLPPIAIIKSIFKIVRAHGGLVIADEVQTGLGRTGNHLWGFINYEVIPDIVTVGKLLGNGHPMGAVICSPMISDTLGPYFTSFGGNPVSCAIGTSVINVVYNEKLMSSACMVGKFLKAEFHKLIHRHEILGDNRGVGLVQSLEIVNSKILKIPAPNLAIEVMYGLRMTNVLVAVTGKHRNILLLTPPMCFNIENSRVMVKKMDEVLTVIEEHLEDQSQNLLGESSQSSTACHHRLAKRNLIARSEDKKRTKFESEHEDNYDDMD